jgi:hypothetical protein
MRPIRASNPTYQKRGFNYRASGVGINFLGGAESYFASSNTSIKLEGPTWDSAHSPEAGYIAYLATGRYQFIESMQFAAAAGQFRMPSSYRLGNPFAILGGARASAWTFRHATQAFICTPDDDTVMRDGLGASIESTYVQILVRVASAPWANNLGVIDADQDYSTSTLYSDHASFQFNYWNLCLGMAKSMGAYLTEQGRVDMESVMSHVNKHTVGLLGDNSGWNYRVFEYQQAYGTSAALSSFPPDTWYATWGEAYQANLARRGYAPFDDALGLPLTETRGLQNVSNLQGLWFCAALAKEQGATGADAAWERLSTSSTAVAQAPGFNDCPTYGVVPR